MTTTASVFFRVYGERSEPRVAGSVFVWNGNDLVASSPFFDEHLVVFNCLGALRAENMIDFIRALHPGIKISAAIDEFPEIGSVDNAVLFDINKHLLAAKEAATS